MHQHLKKNHKYLIKGLYLLSYIIILIGIALGTYAMFKEQVNECTSDPFVYGAQQMEKTYNYTFYGLGYFLTPIGVESPRITFNSTHLSWGN